MLGSNLFHAEKTQLHWQNSPVVLLSFTNCSLKEKLVVPPRVPSITSGFHQISQQVSVGISHIITVNMLISQNMGCYYVEHIFQPRSHPTEDDHLETFWPIQSLL